MVFVRRASVKNMRVRQELDVAHFQDHVQSESVAGIFEDLHGLQLGGGKRGDDTRVGEASQRADVVRVPSV